MKAMMNGGGPALARTCDENRRSALHFAAALNKPALVARLVAEGAEVNLADREGECRGSCPAAAAAAEA